MELTATLTRTVRPQDTAAEFGDHFPQAAATPFVLGLAEVACHNAVAPTLQDGEVTVGTHASIEHRSPSPVGAVLIAHAALVHTDGRRLQFTVEVFDGDELCATVEHGRAVVTAAKIADRLNARGTST